MTTKARLWLLLIGVPLAAQDPALEVVSIRKSAAGTRFQMRPDPDKFAAANITAALLLQSAFQMQPFQIANLPGWASSERYDVTVKASQVVSRTEMSGLLRSVLEQRFGLAAHRETRDMQVYALVRHNAGPKVQPVPPETPRPGVRAQRGQLIGDPATMSNLAESLGQLLGRPVLDRTELPGKYQFKLEWNADENGTVASPFPSVFTALEEQLGLKLVTQKGMGEFLVVERISRPSEN